MDDARAPRRLAGRLASRLRRGGGAVQPPPEAAPATAPAAPATGTDAEPLVSVVVPVYAVEQYVDDCLRSVLGQTYRNLEVVVVDDGSPDGSMKIVAAHAAADDRVRIVTQANAGLGAARNRGIEEARGDLLTFVDSDDTVPLNAIAAHVRSLQQSGSDFSVGALERQQHETSYVQKPWSRRLHELPRRGVTLEEVPDAMANVFACTKVFRREFVNAIGLRFPVGVRYEDQVPITRAYLEARSFDILPEVVYSWRARRDGSSITQQKARKDDLHDRLAAVDEVARMVRASGSRAVLQSWYGKVFEFDLMAYIRASLDADDAYYATLAETVAHVLDGAPPEAWTFVDLRHRLAAWALVHEGRETLTRLLESPLPTGNIPVRSAGQGLAADTAALGLRDGVPDELLAVTDKDLLVEARLDDLAWDGDDLVVWGVAATRYVDSGRDHRVTLELRRPRGGDPVLVPTRGEHVADANVFVDRHFEDHRDDGFVAAVPAADLVALTGDAVKSVWHTRATCASLGGTRQAVLRERVGHGGSAAPRGRLVDGALVDVQWSDRLGLVLQVRRDWVVLSGVEVDGEAVVLRLRAAPGVEPRAVAVQQRRVGAVRPVDADGGEWSVSVATDDLAFDQDVAGRRLVVETAEGRQPLLALDDLPPVPAPGGRVVVQTGDGFVRAVPRRGVLVAEHVDLTAAGARVRGVVVGDPPADLALVGPRGRTRAVPVDASGAAWSAELPLVATPLTGGDPLPLPRDTYRLESGADHAVLAAPGLVPGAAAGRGEEPEWSARRSDAGELLLHRGRGDDLDTHTRHGQRSLQNGPYVAVRAAGRAPVVLFDSFVGRGLWHGCAAVARALATARPDLELAWSTRDESLPVPPGTRPVLRQSAEWYDRLGAAAHVVTNGTMPRFYEKAPGQRLVQLWTGTPVLRFGHAVVAEEEGGAADVRALDRDVAQWDLLCTGGPAATAWMREATGFGGRVAEVGHPGLDTFARERDGRRAAVREMLGLGDGPVLLYAPTTRHAVRAHTKREKIAHFEPELVRAEVPGLTVLHRGHPNTANQPTVVEPGVVDVTLYPELADLVLAADAVVTDYSSLIVDVLASDTPLGLLVPDREDFEERGFFPDLFDAPPGPLAATTEDLLPWLTEGLGARYEGRQRLREQLLPLDDGHAAERLVADEFG